MFYWLFFTVVLDFILTPIDMDVLSLLTTLANNTLYSKKYTKTIKSIVSVIYLISTIIVVIIISTVVVRIHDGVIHFI